MKTVKQSNHKRMLLKALIIITTAYLFGKYVIGNWDNMKNYIFSLFR
jgi:hypothetical protein